MLFEVIGLLLRDPLTQKHESILLRAFSAGLCHLTVNQRGNSWVVLVVALLGLALFGWAGYELFVVGGHRYTVQDLEIVSGKLHQSGVIKRSRGGDVLQIWLEGERLPFQANSVNYPRCYRKDALPGLAPGAELAMGILPGDRVKPYRSLVNGQEFLNIYSLSVNGAVALSVGDYNRCAAENEKVGRIVVPILFSVSVVLLIYSVQTIRRERRSKTVSV